jgi:NAD(P)-dependent dehydrogenase (short-subunit alcohol dehydrogenase family)
LNQYIGGCERDNALTEDDVTMEEFMESLKGKVALITGADSTVGLLTAKEFLKEGAQVIVTVSRCSELPGLLEQLGGATVGMCVDVSDVGALSRLFERIDREVGKLDILFPNADLGESRSSIFEVEEEHPFGMKSLTFTISKALPVLHDGGSIILITSAVTAGSMKEESAVYVAATCARTFARELVRDVKERYIRVNGVSLGTVDVAKIEDLPSVLGNEQRPFPQEVTLRRESNIEQVATAIVSLATDDSDITGRALIMKGSELHLSPFRTELLLDRLGSPEKVAMNAAFLASGTSASINGMELLVDDHMIAL